MSEVDNARAKEQAKAQLDSILEMVKALRAANDSDDDEAREAAETRIREDALSVEVRSGWYTPGRTKAEAEEFTILLCTGGPACRIIGDLGAYNAPENARIKYKDWFTEWENYPLDSDEEEAVLEYCRQFYYGG